jgi:release factor glutamine methyltransferase
MQTARALYLHIHQQLLPLGASAKQQAYWLLEGLAGISRTQIAVDATIALKAGVIEQLQQAVSRLLAHEPLQYVLGRSSFWGYDFKVSPAVLIPRPETEELVQRIVQRHQQQAKVKILDVCTGSGCIAFTLAKELPHSQVWATDVSPEALAVAEYNRKQLGVDAHIVVSNALTEAFPTTGLDIVVSNPPYVLEKEAAFMQPNVLQWEPHLALFVPNNDALLFFKAIAQEAYEKLNPGGWLYFEINEAYGKQIVELLQPLGFTNLQVLLDMQGKVRIAEGQKPNK